MRVILLSLMLILVGCQTNTQKTHENLNSKGEVVTRSTVVDSKTQKTLRREASLLAAQNLCGNSTIIDRYNEQRIISKVVDSNGTEFLTYNQTIAPFDTNACTAEVLAWQGGKVMSGLFGFLNNSIQYLWPVALLNAAGNLKGAGGTKVTGDNNVVREYNQKGSGNTQTNQEAGGIPITPTDINPISLGSDSGAVSCNGEGMLVVDGAIVPDCSCGSFIEGSCGI